jgi:hypothetical protein
MPLTTLATLLGLAAAGLYAWSAGGTLAAGALAGTLAGAALTGWGVLRQRRVIAHDPARALRVLVESFLLKLLGVAAGAGLLAFVPTLARAFDWRAFVVAFGGGALTVLLPGTFENARRFGRSAAE